MDSLILLPNNFKFPRQSQSSERKKKKKLNAMKNTSMKTLPGFV